MDESQPQITPTPTPSIVVPPAPLSSQIKPSKQSSTAGAAIFACVLAVVAIAACGFTYMTSAAEVKKVKDTQATELKKLEDTIKKLEDEAKYEELQVDKDRIQAVFLTSKQVYFGKITEVTKDTVKLENIYYLRNGEFDKSGAIIGGADVSLAKLGNELHGPDDVMYIERKNLEFWENLKDDSQVVKAIKEYEKNL